MCARACVCVCVCKLWCVCLHGSRVAWYGRMKWTNSALCTYGLRSHWVALGRQRWRKSLLMATSSQRQALSLFILFNNPVCYSNRPNRTLAVAGTHDIFVQSTTLCWSYACEVDTMSIKHLFVNIFHLCWPVSQVLQHFFKSVSDKWAASSSSASLGLGELRPPPCWNLLETSGPARDFQTWFP